MLSMYKNNRASKILASLLINVFFYGLSCGKVVNAFVPSSPAGKESFSVVSTNNKNEKSSPYLSSSAVEEAVTTSGSRSASSTTSNSNVISSSVSLSNSGPVEFAPPISTVDQIQRAAKLWYTAIPIVANCYGIIGNLKLQEILGINLSEEEVEKIWNEQHEDGAQKLSETVADLKGFYVKVAQIVSTRQDLFPKQYTDALSGFTDNLDPMPISVVKAVIEQELLNPGETFEDVFTEFDEEPLGAASVAQVHRAMLSKKYGGPREVAVKVQRPSIESKLLGDVANLKALAKAFQNTDVTPIDYYTVCCELEKQLANEFDFVAEAAAMERIYTSLTRSYDGTKPTEVPLVMPRIVPGLVSRRVYVMDYLRGVPLSRAREEMEKKGIDPNGPEAQLFGRKLLKALTYSFGRNILETGFFHADPHPGNIFVLDDGNIGLIDFGQVKQISGRYREALARVMIVLAEQGEDENDVDVEKVGNLALELGVTFNDDAKKEAPAAVAFWLFEGMRETLPGGYDKGELSPNSPLLELKSFPQDLVLVGRSTILIKALSSRLNIPWSLAKEWAPIAKEVLDVTYNTSTNNYNNVINGSDNNNKSPMQNINRRVRFREVWDTFKLWGVGKRDSIVQNLPRPIRSRLARIVLRMEERKNRRQNR